MKDNRDLERVYAMMGDKGVLLISTWNRKFPRINISLVTEGM